MAGVVFVILRLKAYAHQVDLSRFDLIVWMIVGLLAIAYGAANLLLARAWWHLLIFFDVYTNWVWAVKTYGLSQLARYVPGNIFHLAGRQAMGMAVGLTPRPLAMSALWELGLVAVAGGLFGILAAPLIWPGLSVWITFVMFVAISVTLCASLGHLLSPSISAALFWQMIFLAMSGAVFIGVLEAVSPLTNSVHILPALCGAYVIAWLAGLITPGAPAGLGVREMVLLFLLGEQIAQADLLLVVVLCRGVTVLGDLFYFMISTLLKKSGFADE